jgi:hypothetical protein
MAGADAALEFDSRVETTLELTCELAQVLMGAHQAAMSMTFAGDYPVRRSFSLSDDRRPEAVEARPPLRALLAVPIVGEDGVNCGLLRVSDRVDGTDFDEDDERRLQRLAALAAVALDAQARVRKLRGAEEIANSERDRWEAR